MATINTLIVKLLNLGCNEFFVVERRDTCLLSYVVAGHSTEDGAWAWGTVWDDGDLGVVPESLLRHYPSSNLDLSLDEFFEKGGTLIDCFTASKIRKNGKTVGFVPGRDWNDIEFIYDDIIEAADYWRSLAK